MAGGQFRIRDMEIIVALHEEGNMTQAAKRLGFTEPALSKQLKEIERRIQTPLFERGNGGVVATASGRAFVAHAMEIIQSFRRAIHEAHESKHSEPYRLRIGVSTCHPLNLIEILRSVELRLYKNLSVEIVTAYSFELMDSLQHHELELAVITSPPPNALITSARFATNPFMIVVREGHPLAGKTSVKLNELGPYPWVFFNRNIHHHMHDLIAQRIRAEGVAAGICHSVSQEEHAVSLLTDDHLLAWLTPTGAQRAAQNGLKSIPLDDPQIRLEMHIATLANNKSPLVSEFVRSFMKRIEEQRPPMQLQLPIGLGSAPSLQ
jgi:LysR family transcriptional regulator, benzoate and cis,cis-muconate-responsive activator of ben and cat genes